MAYNTCAGGFGHKDESFVEYDLDVADKEWLEKFNDGQEKLPARRFELLLWRLELVNAEANERHTTASGAKLSCQPKISAHPLHLQALDLLSQSAISPSQLQAFWFQTCCRQILHTM